MRQNSKNRFNGRYNNRGHRPQMILRNTALDSSGPAGKLHGTALQLFEKYQTAAKDAQIQNDAVLAETYLQYADHYMRIQNQAIANEESLKGGQTLSKKVAEPKAMPSLKEDVDELPVFDTPEVVEIQANLNSESDMSQTMSEETETKDLSLSEMDLSVPVQGMQENHKPQKRTTKTGGRTLRLKKEMPKETSVA